MNAHAAIPFVVTPDTIPSNHDELIACLGSWEWRIFSGQLYKIMVKEDDDDDDGAVFVMPFEPNESQRAFLAEMHYRNIILKARQLGFTTLIAILWLDHALFNADQRCCIIAHTKTAATRILRDKVMFAYERLPDWLRECMPLSKDAAEEIMFAHNNSAIEVTVSARSGTFHRLHVSEMGKVAAKQPQKAVEIVTGSLPSVPKHGIAVIESTAEGQEGEFYKMSSKAEALSQMPGNILQPAEWKFCFYAWWKASEYRADPTGVIITQADHLYFNTVEVEMGTTIDLEQRAWYVLKRTNDFSDDQELMWREMPSTPAECWQRSTEGTFYAPQLAKARMQGRITTIPHIQQTVVHTFWDIGAGDGTGIWLMQHVGTQHRFLRYIQGWAEGYSHYVKELRDTGWLFGIHYLPHDADQKRQMENKVAAPVDMLRELAPDWHFEIVPRVHELQHGIQLTREKFPEAWFDEEGCKEGLEHLKLYKKKWNNTLGAWDTAPEKLTGHSEAADAFRQWAQGYNPIIMNAATRPRRRNRPTGGMTV